MWVAENAIDLSVLPDLTDQDLEKLGVLLGHRRKLLRAIASLEAASRSAPGIVVAPLPATAPRSVDARALAVLAAPVMINVIEAAALNTIEHLLPAGHQSLGIHLDVSHVAATPVGLLLIATAAVARFSCAAQGAWGEVTLR